MNDYLTHIWTGMMNKFFSPYFARGGSTEIGFVATPSNFAVFWGVKPTFSENNLFVRRKHRIFAPDSTRHASCRKTSEPGRVVYFHSLMRYTKQALSLAEQIDILRQRGLLIDDEALCLNALSNISYFRLAGYWRPFEQDKEQHIFKSGSRFSSVVQLYWFDSELKIIIFAAIQRIEIAVRTKMIQHVAKKHGPFWFIDETLAIDHETFEACLSSLRRELSRTSDEFIREHFLKYDEPEFPPAWKTLEVASMGTLSKLYSNLNDYKVRKKIAHEFNIPEHLCMASWLRSLTVIRNACAHHTRLWNAHVPIAPQMSGRMRGFWIRNFNFPADRLYSPLCCIAYWLQSIDTYNTFTSDIKALLSKYPTVDPIAMGFVRGWKDEVLWR